MIWEELEHRKDTSIHTSLPHMARFVPPHKHRTASCRRICHTEDFKNSNAPQGISGRTCWKCRVPGSSPGQLNQNLHQNTFGFLVCLLGFKLWCPHNPLTTLSSVLPDDFPDLLSNGYSLALILRLEAVI